MGETEVGAFLSALATVGHVSASTQNQALSALVFLYAEVLGTELYLLAPRTRASIRSSVTGKRSPPRLLVSLLPVLNGSVSVFYASLDSKR